MQKKIKVDYQDAGLAKSIKVKNALFVAAALVMTAGNVSASL